MTTFETVLKKYLDLLPEFFNNLDNSLDTLNIKQECLLLEIDHICMRLKSLEQVNQLRDELENHAQQISCTEVNGRDIMIYKLHEPLVHNNWIIPCVELPYPKPNQTHLDGWEHVEFVMPSTENTMNGVLESFFTQFPALNKEMLLEKYQYSEDEPHAVGDQLPNPTIGIKVDGIGLKFHANSIEKVVQ